jgi:MFS family permease
MDDLLISNKRIFRECLRKELGKVLFYFATWALFGFIVKISIGGLLSESQQYVAPIIDVVQDRLKEIGWLFAVFVVIYFLAYFVRLHAKENRSHWMEVLATDIQSVTISEGGSAFYALFTLMLWSSLFYEYYHRSPAFDIAYGLGFIVGSIIFGVWFLAFFQAHKERARRIADISKTLTRGD